MIGWIAKIIAKILSRIIVLILIFLGINYFLPKLTRDKLQIGSQVGNSFFEYNFSTRENHLSYMESLETPYGTLRYLDRGPRDGHVILLVHGIPSSSRTRRHVTARLIDRGYRVIVPDLLGYGVSKSTDVTMSTLIERQGIVLNSLMKHLSVTGRTQVAHDRGSLVTRAQVKETILYSGTAAPQHIEDIILVNAPGYTDGHTPSPVFQLHSIISTSLLYLSSLPLGGKQITRLLLHYDIPDIHAMGSGNLHGYSAPLQLGSRKNYAAAVNKQDAYDSLLDIYGTIYKQRDIPTTIIWGSANASFDSRHQIPFYKQDFGLSDDRTIIIPGGHYLQEQTPGKLAQSIDQAIKKDRPQN